MDYMLGLTDSSRNRMVVLALAEPIVRHAAIDVVFEVLGNTNYDELAASDVLAAGQIDDFKAFQNIIFASDAQGPYIKDGINFKVNGRDLDPDAPLLDSFLSAERNGKKYMRCDIMLEGAAVPAPASAQSMSQEEQVVEFARMMFLHQIAIGFAIDVTAPYPELLELIKYAESKGLIEVDVKKVAYNLTDEGQRVHEKYISEARDLIRRFDIYSDVDIDSSGNVHFGTGFGRDWRIPAFELEGVDPFRARFLLGLNDGEWNDLSNWMELCQDPNWYSEIFGPVELAPSIDDVGRKRMETVVDQAKELLRQQQY
jgi:hypothetical protein